MEIIITAVIIIIAVYVLYRNLKNKKEGKCNCSGCPSATMCKSKENKSSCN